MILEIIINTAGGLALFMMAMTMMTEGLKLFAGNALKSILQHWTSNVYRGVISGALITGFVQSSSAVTVATIGFVNAGILTLQQAIGVVFGANLGTTITGWLVSIIGFGFNIEALAMPLLAFGALFHYASTGKRYQGLSHFMLGLGLFFLALSILKSAFSGISDTFGTEIFRANEITSTWVFVLFGFILTAFTQSSSAAIAIILTAVSEGVLGVNLAAAAVIGANIGTTTTTVFATMHATANARRVAVCHVAFNVITGIIALAMLPLFILGVAELGHMIGVKDQPAPFLALFHTSFNLVGVILLVPFSRRIGNIAEKMFVTQEESLSHPQFLDKTVKQTPVLAIAAIWNELDRLYNLSCELVLMAIAGRSKSAGIVKRHADAIFSLGRTINEFATNLSMENMAREQAEELTSTIRTSRYLEDVTRLSNEFYNLSQSADEIDNEECTVLLAQYLKVTEHTVNIFFSDNNEQAQKDVKLTALTDYQKAYQDTKEGLLQVTVKRHLSVDQIDELLDSLSHSRRLIQQLLKADSRIHKIRNGETTDQKDQETNEEDRGDDETVSEVDET